MRVIRHAKGTGFADLFEKYGLAPSDETALFLLPGVSAVEEAENRYCEEGVWGKNLLTFNELSDFVNETSPNLKKKRISRVQVLSVIGNAAAAVSEKLEVFGEFSDNRDFLGGLASVILKLKQGGVTPKKLSGIVGRIRGESLRNKLKDILLVYERYEAILFRKGFLDDADSLRVVSREIDGEGLDAFFPSAKKLVVFGFSEFTRVELDVVKSLSSALPETFLFVSDFGDLAEYENSFFGRLKKSGISFEEDSAVVEKEPPAREPEKEYVEFRDPHDEIEHVSRQIKRLVVDGDLSPSDFRVLVRSGQKRGRSVAAVFERNGVAVHLRDSGTLAESVYGRLAADVLRLRSGNFHRDDVIRLLANPLFHMYLGGGGKARRCAYEIRRLSSADSREYRTVSGLGGWKRIFGHIRERDLWFSPPAGEIEKAFDLVSSKFGRKSFAALTSDLREVLSFLRVSGSSAGLIERGDTTRECFDEFFAFFRELSFIYGEFDRGVADAGEYLSMVEESMRDRVVPYKTPREGDSPRVAVTSFSAARGTRPGFLFLLGLSETAFPSPLPADPVLRNREKTEINAALGSRVFEDESFHYEREKHLFSALSAAASEKVFFSWSRSDGKSKETRRSDFLEGEEVSEAPAFDGLTAPREVFSAQDALIRLFSFPAEREGGSELREICAGRFGFDLAECLSRGVRAEGERMRPLGPYTGFEGVLEVPPAPPEHFSPTQLEGYGTCPFRYFAGRMLKLGSLGDPEESRVSQLDLGSLAHDVLNELMAAVFADGAGPPDMKRVSELYGGIAERYRDDPAFSHLPKTVAEMEKRRFFDHLLPGFVSDEVARIEKGDFTPGLFEEDVEFRVGGAVVRGKIDRVDVSGPGGRAAGVVDYKIGGVGSKRYFDYRNLQLPLYLEALSGKGFVPSSASYLSVGKPGENVVEEEPFTGEAVALSEFYIENIQRGFFPPFTGRKEEGQAEHELVMSIRQHPCSYCDYADLCRAKSGTVRKTGGGGDG